MKSTIGNAKFVASSSAASGQNPFIGKGNTAASLEKVATKFGKAKDERISPAADRGKGKHGNEAGKADGEWTLAEHAIVELTPTNLWYFRKYRN